MRHAGRAAGEAWATRNGVRRTWRTLPWGTPTRAGTQVQHVARQADVEAVKNAVTGMSGQQNNDACTCS
jgi:hypothetical protein